MSPPPTREQYARAVEWIADALADALGVNIDTSFGPTSFRHRELAAGFEADACLHVQNESRVRGKGHIDLSDDSPPDVVVEIDITNPSLSKLEVYARLSAPEVWRFDGTKLEILHLQSGKYAASERSAALPQVSAAQLGECLARAERMDWTAWRRFARAWAEAAATPHP